MTHEESVESFLRLFGGRDRLMELKLHHVGLVAQSISELTELFRDLGLTDVTQPETDPIQKVAASFVAASKGQDIYIELLEPLGDDSPITNFLKEGGGGLHHLCFEVDDIDAIASELMQKGFQMVCPPVECTGYDKTFRREHAQASKIAFFLLPNKILIELLQKGEG